LTHYPTDPCFRGQIIDIFEGSSILPTTGKVMTAYGSEVSCDDENILKSTEAMLKSVDLQKIIEFLIPTNVIFIFQVIQTL
jgi:hypothetical protein